MGTVVWMSFASLATLTLAPFAAWLAADGADPLPFLPREVHVGVLCLAGIAVLVAVLVWRVAREDALARREADGLRERAASRSASPTPAHAAGARPDPHTQLATIRIELGQLQSDHAFSDPLLAVRMDMLCARVDRLTEAIRDREGTVEPG